MDLEKKLAILADAAKYDASCASSGVKQKRFQNGLGTTERIGICHSYTPDGRCVSLLKILLTNACIFDCTYCINRVSSQIPRAKFSPDEVVTLTIEFYKRNYIEGLFLSSGVQRTPDGTMEELIKVAKDLRTKHRFGGYIHLKAVAGASPALFIEAGKWADRLSANIELPTQVDLNHLAPAKDHASIETVMSTIKTEIKETFNRKKDGDKKANFAPGGQSTQMIVGATPSTDATILKTADHLYKTHNLRRVYYSAFSPIPDADPRLPLVAPPLVREHRLYQADWLLRFYDFNVSELTTADQPNLDLKNDPKLSWALRNKHFFPVDVNRAPEKALLRVPGLGVGSVKKIIQVRKHHLLTWIDLKKMRVALEKIKFFVTVNEPVSENKLQLKILEKENEIWLPKYFQRSLFDDPVTGEPLVREFA